MVLGSEAKPIQRVIDIRVLDEGVDELEGVAFLNNMILL
jgi:hypothetical protein